MDSDSGVDERPLNFQLEILKSELNTIEAIIARMDSMAQTAKNWSILTWAGGVAISLQSEELRNFVGVTAFLPFLFWFIDAMFRRLQRRTIYRQRKIQEWVNSSSVAESYQKGRLCGLRILDPVGYEYADEDDFKKFSSISRPMKFGEVKYFYASKILFSIFLQLIILFVN